MDKWVETKKEYEYNERGELIPRKVTRELKDNPWKYKPKEAIDVILRFIGLIAIAVPILLFYQGQNAERNRQKALFQLDVYTSTGVLLHKIVNEPLTSLKFSGLKDQLFLETYPKLVLINDKQIIDSFIVVKNLIDFYFKLSQIHKVVYDLSLNASDIGNISGTLYDFKRDHISVYERRMKFYYDSSYFNYLVEQLRPIMHVANLPESYKKDISLNLSSLETLFFKSKESFFTLDSSLMAERPFETINRIKEDPFLERGGIRLGNKIVDYSKYLTPHISKFDSVMIESNKLFYNEK